MLQRKMGHAPPPAGQWHAPGWEDQSQSARGRRWKTQALAACGATCLVFGRQHDEGEMAFRIGDDANA